MMSAPSLLHFLRRYLRSRTPYAALTLPASPTCPLRVHATRDVGIRKFRGRAPSRLVPSRREVRRLRWIRRMGVARWMLAVCCILTIRKVG